MDADTHGQLVAPRCRFLADRNDLERRANGTLGVVVVRERPTEAEEDAVPAVALDRAPEPVRDLHRTLVVPLDQLAEVLRVDTRRQLCRSDEIAADHRDRTALDAE